MTFPWRESSESRRLIAPANRSMASMAFVVRAFIFRETLVRSATTERNEESVALPGAII